MTIPYFEVAAFARRPFAGNPAGICLLENDWLPDDVMQNIAAENNLAETAFVVPRGNRFGLRWMTPKIEIDLCGHATLGSAHVLVHHRGYSGDAIMFDSKSGELRVTRDGDRFVLDFPAQPAEAMTVPAGLAEALGATPQEVLKRRDFMAIFETEKEVRNIRPKFDAIAALDAQGVVVTAAGDQCDFVSRYFAPAAGIPEDPVTGSTHCCLIPYWSQRLGKDKLLARQLSQRGGDLFCEYRKERVLIGGYAATYLEGEIQV
jgi:PhzF family phenazine biosynthesis protein